MKLLSIVVPCYNSQDYMEHCIASLLPGGSQVEILIVDEALSVGDVFFQAKCYHKFEEFKRMGKTIMIVSHDLSSIAKYCDRVILLNQGVKLGEGTPKAMIDDYKRVLVGQYELPASKKEQDLLNDAQVQEAVQTPSNMHVTCYLPAELAEKNPALVLSDGNGNRILMECAKMNTQDDGSQIQEMVFNTSQADQFVMQVFDKNAGTDENGGVPLIAEIPFSMGE